MDPLKRFGSYGFLSAMLALQLSSLSAFGNDTAKEKAERGLIDAKKSGRSVKRDLKKAGRKITGQDNAWDDTKDAVSDAGKNVKDEAKFQGKKAKRKLGE